jgi:hypothetical protein
MKFASESFGDERDRHRRGGWRTDRAASVVWAATLPDDGATGGFFGDRPLPW